MILTIANQKGGVGKTTTAVNLSAALGAAERSVLLVDLDPQGNATTGMGLEKQAGRSIYSCLIEEDGAGALVQATDFPFVDAIASHVELIGAELELVDAARRELRLRAALSEVSRRYDYVLIDCPPSLGLLTVNSLAAADGVLVPVQCEYYALEGLAQLWTTIERVRDGWNGSLEIYGMLLTMFDGRTNLSSQVVDEVRRHFGQRVFETMIPRNVRLSEAPGFGMPVLAYDIKSNGAQSYLRLAREILDGETKGAGPGFGRSPSGGSGPASGAPDSSRRHSAQSVSA